MRKTARQKVDQCVEAFKRGTLTEDALRQTLERLADEPAMRQDLLYLQSHNDFPGQAGYAGTSNQVIGMMMLKNGEQVDIPDDPDRWPYQTVADAIRDGWRIIKFPELSLQLNENRTYGLGCEFILEKWAPSRP